MTSLKNPPSNWERSEIPGVSIDNAPWSLTQLKSMNKVQLRAGSGPKDEMASLNSATPPSRLWHVESVMGGLKWQGSWNPQTTGNGVSVSGTIVELRNHTLQDSSKHHRLVAVVIQIENARKRVYDENGVELETSLPTEKLLAKGHINKYDRKEVIDPYKLTSDQLVTIFGGHALPTGYFDQQQSKLHPNIKDRFEFWGEVEIMKFKELKKGDEIKFKTKGDSVIIESCSKLQETAKNYHGEDVLGGWTGKIQVGSSKEEDHRPLPGDNMQGVDDSEWD